VLLFAPIRWAFKLAYFAVLASVVYVVVSGFQVVSASHLPTSASVVIPGARAVVVLGAPTDGAQPGADLSARLEQALALYQDRRAPTILVVGAPAQGANAAEPQVMASWLEQRGVPAAAVVQLSAPDAATGLSQVEAELGRGARVVVVTDAIDALWTKGAASHDGLSAVVSPAIGSEKAFYEELGQLWRQATGVAVGRVIGYANAPWAAH
jgi:hypothetical protein